MQATRRPAQPAVRPSRTPALRCRGRRLQCDASVIWRQLEGSRAWVAHPRAARVKGVIHFLGGAFAGAAPQLLYNGFVELLADAGYTTIATPYAVTFRHDQCARDVRQAFLDSVSELRAAGRSYLVPPRAPQFCVGHSNGALLHLLASSFEAGASQGNVIISYNNLQVSDAIPIPGLLDGLQPTVLAARSMSESFSSTSSSEEEDSSSRSGSRSGSKNGSRSGSRSPLPSLPSSQAVLAAAAASLPPFLLGEAEQQLLRGAAPALDQLGAILNEVGDGLTDFRPTPQESRAIVAAGYACPATLLVRFDDDSIDETPEMMQLLTRRLSALLASSSNTNGSSSSPLQQQQQQQQQQPAGQGSSRGASPGWSPAVSWSSADEDIDAQQLELEWQQLQQRQLAGLEASGNSSSSSSLGLRLQQLVLPGSHVTPCGAAPARSAGQQEAALATLAARVLAWLEQVRLRPAAPLVPPAQSEAERAVLQQWAASSSQLPTPADSPLGSLEEELLQQQRRQLQQQLVTVGAATAPAPQQRG